MRVTSNPNSVDHWRRKGFASGACTVVFEGEVQLHAIEADDKEGYVRRFVAGQDGRILGDDRGKPVIEIVYGQTAIIPFEL